MLRLNDLAKQQSQTHHLVVSDDLPVSLKGPCALDVSYRVEAQNDIYLIHLRVVGDLTAICQRCMHEYPLSYDNQTVIAVCRSDARAEELLEEYECIVASNWQVSLDELIHDELHLYVPEFHPDFNACDDEINQFLTEKNESY